MPSTWSCCCRSRWTRPYSPSLSETREVRRLGGREGNRSRAPVLSELFGSVSRGRSWSGESLGPARGSPSWTWSAHHLCPAQHAPAPWFGTCSDCTHCIEIDSRPSDTNWAAADILAGETWMRGTGTDTDRCSTPVPALTRRRISGRMAEGHTPLEAVVPSSPSSEAPDPRQMPGASAA